MRSFTLALLLTLFASLAIAQTQKQGALTGTVTDTSGALVSGADVTATNVATAITSKIKNDQHGSYPYSFLAPGTYTLVATAEGFQKTELRSVIVNLGTNTNANVNQQFLGNRDHSRWKCSRRSTLNPLLVLAWMGREQFCSFPN